MAPLKPVYLLHGDDPVKLDAWRVRVRARAEAAEDASLELLEGRRTTPAEVAAALDTLSFAAGERFIVVDGIETWKAAALEPLEAALATIPPETFLVLIARPPERGSKAPPKRLAKAVEAAGGEVREFAAPKPWKLAGWLVERARELGVQLDGDAAKALLAIVGPHQRRLERELEKLALGVHPQQRIELEDVHGLAAGDNPPKAYDLADAVVASEPVPALALATALAADGERPSGLLYPIVRRLREVHRAAELIEAGTPRDAIAKELPGPPWAAKRTLGAAADADREQLEQALTAFAELEIELRGEGDLRGLDEETYLALTLQRAAA